MDYLFFGIQGSGKGTQTRLVEENFGYPVFETGAELRAIAQKDTELGRKVNEIISAGHLVPTEIVMEIVAEFIKHHQDAEHILFDGIPRSQDQQEALHALLDQYNRTVTAVHIKLDDDTAMERLLARGRSDDNPESIQTRIDTYYEKTEPLLEKYANQDKLIEINGVQSIEQVYSELQTKLGL